VLVRPQLGEVVSLELDCDPGFTLISGGTENLVANPQDVPRVHMLDSGPTALGWHTSATVTQQFSNGGTLEIVLTIRCAEVTS